MPCKGGCSDNNNPPRKRRSIVSVLKTVEKVNPKMRDRNQKRKNLRVDTCPHCGWRMVGSKYQDVNSKQWVETWSCPNEKCKGKQ